MNTYSMGFIIAEDKVALVTKAKSDWQVGKLNGVGGHIEAGELPAEAMARECFEECGLKTTPYMWSQLCLIRCIDYELHVFYLKIDKAFKLKGLPDEPVEWYLIDSLPENAIFNLKWLIPMCLDSNLKLPLMIDVVR